MALTANRGGCRGKSPGTAVTGHGKFHGTWHGCCTTMARAIAAPWPMGTRGAYRGSPWLAMAPHGKSHGMLW